MIVYAYLIEAPVAMADYSELDVYYYTEDHIGRPFALRDENQTLRWYEMHYPFGEVIEEDTPNGDMSAGLGDYAITWKPNFRFPGQYEDIDMFPFTHNHFREYLPQFGRYNRVDPLSEFFSSCNPGKTNDIYVYVLSNPVSYYDFWGLERECKSGRCPDCPGGKWGTAYRPLGIPFPNAVSLEGGAGLPSFWGAGVNCTATKVECKSNRLIHENLIVCCAKVGVTSPTYWGGFHLGYFGCVGAKCIEDLRGRGMGASAALGIVGPRGVGAGGHAGMKSLCGFFGGGVGMGSYLTADVICRAY